MPTALLDVPALDAPLRLMRAEYLELPGLNLTKKQVQRLWNLDPILCDALLDMLVADRFLRQTAKGEYVRADSPH